MRFLDFNYAFQANVGITASTEDANFPASNFRDFFRARTWRSDFANGNFEITSSNNKIDFIETNGGPEIIATLTIAVYTATTLAAEIKARMDAATLNARVYTISFSSTTGKWTIAGQTFLSLPWSSGSSSGVSSTGPSLGYATTDQTGATSYVGASIAIHVNENIVYDLKTTESVDSIVLFFDPLDGIQLSNGAVVRIQANPTDIWTAPAVDVVLTFDEAFEVASHFFTTSQDYRYWRLQITDPKNVDLFVEVGCIVIAKATTLGDSPQSGFTHTIRDRSKVEETEFGQAYVNEFPFRRSVSFDYKVLEYVDVKTLEAMYKRNGVRIPVTVVLDDAEDCFDKDHFLIYGRFDASLSETQENVTLFNIDMSIVETM